MPLATRAADAATAAYQRAMTSKCDRLYQQEIFRLQRRVQLLRDEVRHCYDVIDVMGRDLEAQRRNYVVGELPVQPNSRTQAGVARAFYWKVYADVLDDLWDVGRPPDEEQ